MKAKIGIAAAIVAAIGAILGGIWLVGRDGEAASPSASATALAATRSQADSVADLPTFRMTIPTGWERLPEREGEDGALLFLRGPRVGDSNLILAANVMPVSKGVTLDGFMASYTADWPIDEFPIDEDIKFCEQDAHILGFTNGDGDNLVLFCIHKQSAHVIVMVAPADKMPEHISQFYSLVGQIQLYE